MTSHNPDPLIEIDESVVARMMLMLEDIGPILSAHTDEDSTKDWEAVAATARQEADQLRAEIVEDMADFDVFDVLANMLLFNAPVSWDEYRESEHAGRLVNVEYAAALLLPRARRTGDPDLREPAAVGGRMAQWNQQIGQILRRRGLGHMAGTADADPRLARAEHQQFQLELTVRNPCYDWQEERHLIELFSHEPVAEIVENILGLTIKAAVRMIRLCGQRIAQALTVGGNAGVAEGRAFSQKLGDIRAASDESLVPDEFADLVDLDDADIRDALQALTMWSAWNKLGDRSSFTSRELAESADVSVAAAQSFLDLFSLPLGTDDVPEDPIRALQTVKARPIVRDDKQHLCIDGGDLLFAAREALESVLKQHDGGNSPAWRRYERHRADWTEAQADQLLCDVLRPDQVGRNLTWTESEDQFELDRLFVIDRYVLTVEVKAGAFTEPARRAASRRLERDLTKLVATAHMQAERARAAVAAGTTFRDGDGDPFIVEIIGDPVIIPLVITLDELVVAPQVWSLARSGFLPGDAPPTTMAVADLELVTDILQRPSRLLHYLSRRHRMNERGGLVAHEEADLLMYYLRQGLYLEDAEANVTTIIESQTDELDAYYYHRYGGRQTPANKPAPRLHPELLEIIDVLEEHRPQGWTHTAILLLDMAEDLQIQLGDHLVEMKATSVDDGARRDLSIAIDESTRGVTIATAAEGDHNGLAARTEFLAAKNKYVARAGTWTALGIDLSDDAGATYAHLLLDHPWEQDDDLDALADATRDAMAKRGVTEWPSDSGS